MVHLYLIHMHMNHPSHSDNLFNLDVIFILNMKNKCLNMVDFMGIKEWIFIFFNDNLKVIGRMF